MSYMRAQTLANFLIWHEIPKIIKKAKKKINMQQKTKMSNPKQEYLQIPLFFYTFSKPGVEMPVLPFTLLQENSVFR